MIPPKQEHGPLPGVEVPRGKANGLNPLPTVISHPPVMPGDEHVPANAAKRRHPQGSGEEWPANCWREPLQERHRVL